MLRSRLSGSSHREKRVSEQTGIFPSFVARYLLHRSYMYTSFLSVSLAVTDYIIGTTHITNGMSLMNSILAETPRFRPTGLWDNQMDEPAPPPPQPTASIGPSKGLRPRR